ncbi:MAG TPA: glycosyltransferase family 39 protein, partial [Halobacteriales archaeon]|nr:glycosyltransferase family 39 protein [Halobacteriales archaeon]
MTGGASRVGWPPVREQTLAAGLALVAGVLSVAIGVYVFPYLSVNHDEAVYLQQAAMLLEGQLYLRPPVPEAFRPWFFVRDGAAFYPKYAPVPAAMFATGELVGSARVALAVLAAAATWLTYAVVAEVFDRRRGLLAAAFLVASPLFLIQSAVFLPYLPTAVLNLLFAFAYLRADRTRSHRWAAVAGAAIGLAFFARPYTAVLFAAPFAVHALWTFRTPDRPTVLRQSVTAVLGLAGVAVTLSYNALLTGSPFVFPYEAFAPLDGLGFGRRALLGYSVEYTPGLALRANAEVLWTLFARWVAAGPLGTGLAALG